MTKIFLNSNILFITKVIKQSSAKMFKDLKIGDRIVLEIEVEHVGGNRGQTYAPYIRITNIETGDYTLKSFNQISYLLSCFEFS